MIYFLLFFIGLSLSQISVYFYIGVQFYEHIFLSYNLKKIVCKKIIKLDIVHNTCHRGTKINPICYYFNIFFKKKLSS